MSFKQKAVFEGILSHFLNIWCANLQLLLRSHIVCQRLYSCWLLDSHISFKLQFKECLILKDYWFKEDNISDLAYQILFWYGKYHNLGMYARNSLLIDFQRALDHVGIIYEYILNFFLHKMLSYNFECILQRWMPSTWRKECSLTQTLMWRCPSSPVRGPVFPVSRTMVRRKGRPFNKIPPTLYGVVRFVQ